MYLLKLVKLSKGGCVLVINVQNLSKTFGENTVLKEISTTIHKGEVVAVSTLR